MIESIEFEVQGLPPAKSEAKSMLAAGHGHARRVTALLRAAQEARGARGATVFSEGQRIDVQGTPVSIDDPTGAGDFFAAAYLVARVRSSSPSGAAVFANDVASSMLKMRTASLSE